jgi:TonB family protein
VLPARSRDTRRGLRAESMLGATKLGLASLFALSLVSCASSSATHPRYAIDSAAAKREWSKGACAQIRDYWNPWELVRAVRSAEPSPGWPTTVLRIAVQPDGTAPPPEILRSSGISALDDSAVRAVTAALPLPMPPAELLSGASPVTFDLGFRVVGDEDPNIPPVDDKHDPFPVITAGSEYKTLGVVDPLDVQRTVETYRRDVMTCLDRQRTAGFDAIGEVTIEFVIAETGSVYRPIVLKTGGLTRSLEGCLLRTMSHWTFRRPTGGAVKVVFPFRFSGGQAVGADIRSGINVQGRQQP